MAIQNLPCWIGSQAVAETGQRWMSAARPVVRLPPSGWLSEMAGRSKWNAVLYIVGSDGNTVGFSNGYFGGLTNNSGIPLTTLAATNRGWDQVDQAVYCSSPNKGFNGIYCILEGFNNNERLNLANGWVDGVDGTRIYRQNYRLDVFNFLWARRGQNINVLLEAY